MSDDLANSAAQLKCLVTRIMGESNPVKFDELGAEIWQVLEEREKLRNNTYKNPTQNWMQFRRPEAPSAPHS